MATFQKVISEDSSGVVSVSSKLGVGTSSPQRSLHLQSSSANYLRLETTADAGAGMEFMNDNGRYTIGVLADDSFGIYKYSQFAGGYALRIQSGGVIDIPSNVAIGTTSPTKPLTINHASDVWKVAVQHNGADRLLLGTGTSTQTISTAVASDNLDFSLGGSTKMRLKGTSGNFGIGTSSPRGRLDVLGTLGSQGFYVTEYGGAVGLPTDIVHSSGAGTFDIQVRNYRLGTSTGGDISIYPKHGTNSLGLGTGSYQNRFFINGTSGYVGIGITSPSRILHIYDGTYNLQIDGNELFHSDSNPFYIKSADSIIIQPSQSTKATFTSTGLGVGTTSPATQLHLNGTSPLARIQVSSGTNFGGVEFYNNSGSLASAIGNYGHTQSLYFQVQGANNALFHSTGNKFYRDIEIENEFPKVIFDDTQGGAMQIASNSGDIRISQNASGDSATTETIYITNDGKVGIGRSASSQPVANLEIYKNTTSGDDKLFRIYNASGLQWEIAGNGTMSGYTGNAIGNVTELKGTWQTDLAVAGGSAASEASAGDIVFKTNDAEKARITNTGRLGIGTNNPVYGLDVRSTGYFATAQTVDQLRLGDTTNGTTSSIRSVNNTMQFKPDGSNVRFFIGNTGKVGIGTSSPSQIFNVRDSANSLDLFSIRSTGSETRIGIGKSSADCAIDFSTGLPNGGGTIQNTFRINYINNVRTGSHNGRLVLQSNNGIRIAGYNDNPSGNSYGLEVKNTRDGTADKVLNVMKYDSTSLMAVLSSGKIGIGTDSPSKNLHIAGTSEQNIFLQSTSGNARVQLEGTTFADIIMTDTGGGTNAKKIQIRQGDDSFKIRSLTDAGDVGNEMIHLDIPNNRVGIGVTSPLYQSTHIKINSSGTDAMLGLENAGSGDSAIQFLRSSGVHTWTTGVSNAQGKFIISSQHNLAAPRLTILGDGKVGIGTTSPSTELHVVGTIRLNSSQQLQLGGGSTHIDGDSGHMSFDVASGKRFKLDSLSRISLSNNDAGSSNTVFGMSAGNSLNSSSLGNVLFGESAGAGITSADYNTFVGHNAGRFYGHAAAQRNTAIGFQSMYVGGNASTNSAYDNTAVGYQSLRLVTTGIENTAIGRTSMSSLTTGSRNVALGMDTGGGTTTGNDNIFIGKSAGGQNVSGDEMVLIGTAAGFSLNHDTDNDGAVFIGYNAGYNYTTGNKGGVFIGWKAGQMCDATHINAVGNTFVGQEGGRFLDDGVYNVSLGYEALRSQDADTQTAGYNVAVGAQSMKMATDADNNVAIGYRAGFLMTDNQANVAIGYQALVGADSGENSNVAIGFNAGSNINHSSSDQNVIIGTGAGVGGTNQFDSNIAIGSNALNSTGNNVMSGAIAIGYNALTTLTYGSDNTVLGYESFKLLTTGSRNIGVGKNSGVRATTGSENVLIGVNTGQGITTGYNNTYIGHAVASNTSANTNHSNTFVGSAVASSGVFTGDSNVAMGRNAFQNATSATDNTILGMEAGNAITTASNNVAIGYRALSSLTQQSGNVAIGSNALRDVSSGRDNVGIGKDAGASITTGNFNILIGDHNPGSTTMSSHTILGTPDTDRTSIFGRVRLHSVSSDYATFSHYDQDGGSEYALRQSAGGATNVNAKTGQKVALAISNSSKLTVSGDDVGIGTTNPGAYGKLEVRGVGNDTTIAIHEDDGTHKAQLHLRSGGNDVKLYQSGTDNKFHIDTESVSKAFTLLTGGNVGIGETSPTTKLDISGTFRASGNSQFGSNLDVTGNLVIDGDLEVSTESHFYDSVYLNGSNLDVSQSTVTGLNVSVVPSKTVVLQSSALNGYQDANDSTENLYWSTMSTHNTSHITWSAGQGGYYFQFVTAGEYMIYCTLAVTDSQSNDRLNFLAYVTHMNGSNQPIYSYGIGGAYIRDDNSPYDSGGLGGGIRLIVSAGERVKINTELLDTETQTGSAYFNTTKSKIRIEKITYSTT